MQTFKKILALIFTFCLLTALISCNEDAPDNNGTDSTVSASEFSIIADGETQTAIYSISKDGTSDTVTIAIKGGTVVGISNDYCKDIRNVNKDEVEQDKETYNEMFANMSVASHFSTQKIVETDEELHVLMTFVDLDNSENAVLLAQMQVYGGYVPGVSAVTFVSNLLLSGYTRTGGTADEIPEIKYYVPDGEETTVTYSFTQDGVTDSLTLVSKDNVIIGITQNMSTYVTATTNAEISSLYAGYDEMFDPYIKNFSFMRYDRSYSDGVFTLTLSFTDLHLKENAESFAGIALINGYVPGMRASELEALFIASGYTKKQ